jgi:hypothetical protein
VRVELEGPSLIRLEGSGEIDADGMEEALDAFLTAAEPLESFDMLYLVNGLRVPTLGAIRVELARFGRLWSLLPRLGRVALVADQGWVRAAAKAESAVIPGLAVRTFEPGEEADARQWLAG